MWTLALETSTPASSIALLRDGETVELTRLDGDARTAAAITPAIAGMLNRHELKPGDIGLVAVSQGPGSFTGLRIGITTARVFAYAAGADVIAVDTIEVLAAQAKPQDAPLRIVIDAQRGQVVSVAFSATGERLQTQTLDVPQWLKTLAPEEIVSGPVLAKLAPRIGDFARLAPEDAWTPNAETTGKLAWAKHQQGARDDLWRIEPKYHRASAAEEKADAAKKATGK